MKKLKRSMAVIFTAALLFLGTFAALSPTALAADEVTKYTKNGVTYLAQAGEFTYIVTDEDAGEVMLESYTGDGGGIKIPASLAGYSVVGIYKEAFKGKTNIQSVDLSGSPMITEIQEDAFNGCTGLDSVTLNYGLQTIKEFAFKGCTLLGSVTIPSSVTTIGRNAFEGCINLTSVTFSGSRLTEIADYAFYNTKISSIAIPDSVTSIGTSAFEKAPIKVVTFGSSSALTTISEKAFYGSKITQIVIPSGVTDIESLALNNSSLIKVTFKGNTENIADDAFNIGYMDGGVGTWYVDPESEPYSFASSKGITCVLTKLAVGTPDIKSIQATSETSIYLSWSKVTNDNVGYELWYRVRYSTSSAMSDPKIFTTQKNYCSITDGLQTGTRYYFEVTAYIQNDVHTYYGVPSDIESGMPQPLAPTSILAKSYSYNKIKVSWNQVAGAAGYKLYRSTSYSGTYSLLKTLSSTSTYYINTSVTTGTKYYYKVCAYVTSSGTTYLGDYSMIVSAVPTLNKLSSITVKSASYRSIKVSWSSVSGATGYQIQRADDEEFVDNSHTWTTTRTYFTNTSVTTGEEYWYRVRPYRKVDGKYVYGEYTEATKGIPVLGKVTGLKATALTGKIKLTWSTLSGKSGYIIYRYDSEEDDYVEIDRTTSRTYYDDDDALVEGTTYYYKVQAYRITDNHPEDDPVLGTMSDSKSAKFKD